MTLTSPARVFLLSPARLDGPRARLLFQPVTMFPVAQQLRSAEGAPIGTVFSFVSGLYFRCKLAYAEAFARPPASLKTGVFVITTNRGARPGIGADDVRRPCALLRRGRHQAVLRALPGPTTSGCRGARAGFRPARCACLARQHRDWEVRRRAAVGL